MEDLKIDPRAMRTRKMITDSFSALSTQKAFNEISVKDITSKAMINRATFYNHFMDKYDLLEQAISENFSLELNCSQNPPTALEEDIKQIFVSLVSFLEVQQQTTRSHDEIHMIEEIVKTELIKVFTFILSEHKVSKKKEITKQLARMTTYEIIGLSEDYFKTDQQSGPNTFIEPLLPFMIGGLCANK